MNYVNVSETIRLGAKHQCQKVGSKNGDQIVLHHYLLPCIMCMLLTEFKFAKLRKKLYTTENSVILAQKN